MKIVMLTENTACREDLIAEHGLSLYIETDNKRILFDMGQSAAFARNAERLGIDLKKVDLAVLSHGHYDHGGGLEAFLEINKTAPVYVSQYAFDACINASDKYIGLNQELKNCDRLIPVGDTLSLGAGLCLYSCNGMVKTVPTDTAGLQRMDGETPIPDDFRHEQYLLMEEKGKRVCISGCSHKGIENIVGWIPCDVLIGGFHFMKRDPLGEDLRSAAEALKRKKTIYYTCHCTGLSQYEAMKPILEDKLHYLGAGAGLEL